MTDLQGWLDSIGLGKYADAFAKNDLGFDVLPELTESDLKDLGLSMGDRKRLLKIIAALQAEPAEPAGASPGSFPVSTPLPRTDAERRQLTVMFCDLVGSTALSEKLDPEDLREVIGAYRETCAGVITRFGGVIAKYMGDGILVYFGYPKAHEDDTERALKTGLGIVEAVRELRLQENLTLQVRIGIATGLVVAGDIIGEGVSEENAVLGDSPNLAARLQALAKPNTVVIAPETHNIVGSLFEYKDLGIHDLKGISTPVRAWSVIGETEAESRFDASHGAGITPLVGREEEIDLLLRRWQQAKDGEGQIVLLSGEAGVGKSRIVRSFREYLEDEPRNRVLYYCSPFHQNTAFYPAKDQLVRVLRFGNKDGIEAKLDKLEAMLGELGLPVSEIAPLLATLLSLPAKERYPVPLLGAAELKKKIFEALIAMIDAMAIRNPMLMLIEDLHWIDPSTLELLNLLTKHMRSTRIVLLLTYRPEFNPPWSDHSHVTELSLNRLSRKESLAMIAKIADGKAMPEEVVDEIVTKTDGMPLFVEELTKTVLESGILDDAGNRYVLSEPLPPLAIPASLQDTLMARLDRLALVKEVAQLAATLGRTFSHELLATVSPLEAEALDDALSQLLEAGLIYCHGLQPDVTYAFKHALVQDVAYQSLLKGSRLQFHQRIAEALEQRFPETVQTQPELLAEHYTAASCFEPAVAYWHRAGQRAVEHSANLEAIAHLTKGLKLIDDLPDTWERSKNELGMRLTLATAFLSIKGFAAPEVEQTYLRCHELSRRVGEIPQLFTVTWNLWMVCQQRGQLKQAQSLADEALALAKTQPDSALLLQAHHAAWTNLFRLPDLPACREHLDQGLALYSKSEHGSHAFV